MNEENKIIIDVEVDANAEAEQAIDALVAETLNLTAANKVLKKELDAVNTSTKEGMDKAVQLKKQIDANTESLKKTSNTLADVKKGNKGFADSLKEVAPGLSSSIEGIKGMTKASLAFIATPIGAILTALVAVFFLLKQAIGASEETMDALEDAMSVVSAVVEVLQRRLGLLIESLIAFATGDWVKAATKFKEATSDLAGEIERNVDATLAMNQALRDLEDAQNAYTVAAAKTGVEVAKLLLQAKNRSTSEKERIALLDQALAKEKVLIAEELRIADQNLKIVTTRLAKEKGMYQQLNESSEAFAERVIKEAVLANENTVKITEAYAKLYDVRLKDVQFQEKLQNDKDKLEDKALDAFKKREEEKRKAIEETQKRQLEIDKYNEKLEKEAYDLWRQEQQSRYELETEQILRDLENEQKATEERKKMQEETNKYLDGLIEKSAKKRVEIDKKANEAVIGGIALVTKEHSAARILLNTLFKADAIKTTVINGYEAAVAAFKAMAGIPYVGPILGAAAAAAVGIFTAAQVASIAGISFARGGQVKQGQFGGRSHSEGGNKYVDMKSGHTIEVERGENFYVLNKAASAEINGLSSLNVKHGGRSFGTYTHYAALGGQIQTQAFGRVNLNEAEVRLIVKESLLNLRVQADITDIRNAAGKQIEIEDNARIF